jgi:hypothetical protein
MAQLGSFSGGGLGMGVVFALQDGFSKPAATIQAKMNTLSNHTDNMAGKVSTSLKGMMSGGFALLGGIGLAAGIKGLIDLSAALSDKLADVQKTTGLTNAELADYRKTVEGFDTRTSLEDLLDVGKVGGKLGVPKQELAEFTQMIDKAVVALGDEFTGGAEEVSDKLGRLKNVFAETKNQNFGSALNSIGSALNALGSAGASSAPNIAEFGQRIGQLGKLAPTLSQTLGLGATLEELGLNAEIAAGGMTNLLVSAGENQAAFAQHLGMTTKAFQNMLDTSPNDVIKNLAKSFKGVDPSKAIMQMKGLKIGTQESMKVVLGLSDNIDLLTTRQNQAAKAMAEGTSLTDEFNVKNNTFKAVLDKLNKAWKMFAVQLGDMIAPAVAWVAKGFTWMAKALSALMKNPITSWIIKVTGGIVGLALAIYGLKLAFNAAKMSVRAFGASLWAALAPILPIIAIVAAVAAPFILLYMLVQKGRKAFEKFNGETLSGFGLFLARIGGIVTAIREVIGSWDAATQTFSMSKGVAKKLQQLGILDFVVNLSTWVVRLIEFFKGVGAGIVSVFSEMGKFFAKGWEYVKKMLDRMGLLQMVIGKNTSEINKWMEAGKIVGIVIGVVLAALVIGFLALGVVALLALIPIIVTIGLIILIVWALIEAVSWVVESFMWLWGWVEKAYGWGVEFVQNMWDGIKSVWGSFKGWLYNAVKELPIVGNVISYANGEGLMGGGDMGLGELTGLQSRTPALQTAITKEKGGRGMLGGAANQGGGNSEWGNPLAVNLFLDGEQVAGVVGDRNKINQARD